MTYDENVFKEKANRKARKIWIVFAVLLSANYGSDASGGLYPTTSYLIFLALCWLPLIFGEVLLRVKGWATELYRYDLVIGYGIFYTFVICTTASPIAFTYILPVTSLLVLYKNRKFMINCGIVNSDHRRCSRLSLYVGLQQCFRYEKLSVTAVLYRPVLHLLCHVHPSSERIRRCHDRQHQG